MRFVYKHSVLPKSEQFLGTLNVSAEQLYIKLSKLDMASLNVSDYSKKYFGAKLEGLIRSLQFATYLLAWSLDGWKGPLSDFNFLEYGAGSGLTSLLAKEVGLRVIYNDIYETSLKDAEQIAKIVGNRADHYVLGDIDEVIKYLRNYSIECNSVVSSDVIEHIYDVRKFFTGISSLKPTLVSLMITSGANPFHPYIRRKLMKKQIELEHLTRKKEYGHKDRDTLKAYKEARREIIQDYLSKQQKSLNEKVIEEITTLTRGMNRLDLEQTIENYMRYSKYPPKPKHSTNTCDPYTGNWAEHLMDPYSLVDMLAENGLRATVLPGYYGNITDRRIRVIGKILDMIISNRYFSKKSLCLSPFYAIYAIK